MLLHSGRLIVLVVTPALTLVAAGCHVQLQDGDIIGFGGPESLMNTTGASSNPFLFQVSLQIGASQAEATSLALQSAVPHSKQHQVRSQQQAKPTTGSIAQSELEAARKAQQHTIKQRAQPLHDTRLVTRQACAAAPQHTTAATASTKEHSNTEQHASKRQRLTSEADPQAAPDDQLVQEPAPKQQAAAGPVLQRTAAQQQQQVQPAGAQQGAWVTRKKRSGSGVAIRGSGGAAPGTISKQQEQPAVAAIAYSAPAAPAAATTASGATVAADAARKPAAPDRAALQGPIRAAPAPAAVQAVSPPADPSMPGIHILTDLSVIKKHCDKLKQLPCFTFDLDTSLGGSSLALDDCDRRTVTGLSLCCEAGSAAYIPLSSTTSTAVWAEVASLLSSPGPTKVTFGFKQQLLALNQLRKQLPDDIASPDPADPVVDVRIAAWMLSPDSDAAQEHAAGSKGSKASATQQVEQLMQQWASKGDLLQALEGLAGAAGARQRYYDQCKRAALVHKCFQTIKVRR